MQVSLIVSASISDSYGFNILAAQLKKLEPQVHTKLFYIFYDFNKPYPESVLNQLAQLCQGSDLVGISLLSSAFKNSIQITKIIKEKVGCPVIWGGKHPTADPEDSIKYADMICIGEGEDVLIEVIDNLITGHSMENVAGIWYKENDVVHKNNLRVFETNLDRFIFPDYTLDKKFILDVSNMIIRPLEKKDLSSMIKWYPTMITRGCPNCCTFCTNSSDIRLRNMRARSVDNVIKEVKNFIVDNPGVKKVFFRDDCISAMSLSFIEELSAKWKKEVDLPCSCSGVIATSPEFEKKIELLVKAGFTDFKMGIQSGCERVRRFVFARVGETDEVIKKAVDILHRKCPGKINYYMITDNPYETEDELVQSIRFTSRLKRPFSLSLYSLNFYPGTALYVRAMRDNFIDKESALMESTMHMKNTYLNKIFLLLRYFEIPYFIINFFTNKKIYNDQRFQKIFSYLYKFLMATETPHRNIEVPNLKRELRYVLSTKKLWLGRWTRLLVWNFISILFVTYQRVFNYLDIENLCAMIKEKFVL